MIHIHVCGCSRTDGCNERYEVVAYSGRLWPVKAYGNDEILLQMKTDSAIIY